MAKIDNAYKQKAFPGDPSIILTDDPADLALLRTMKEVRAVILKNQLSPQVLKDLNNPHMGTSVIEHLRGPRVTFNEKAMKVQLKNTTMSPVMLRSRAFLEATADIAALYYKASGLKEFDRSLSLTKWFMDANNPDAQKKYLFDTLPSFDTDDVGGPLRMVCNFTSVPKNMGMGFFPRKLTLSQLDILVDHSLKTDNPHEFMKKHGMQTTNAGDVIFYRAPKETASGDLDTHMSLALCNPVPPQNKALFTLKIS